MNPRLGSIPVSKSIVVPRPPLKFPHLIISAVDDELNNAKDKGRSIKARRDLIFCLSVFSSNEDCELPPPTVIF